MKKVIAICGRKRSGKDTAADFISKTYGHCHVKIADPLKKVCGILFGYTQDQMENDRKEIACEPFGISPRQAMQFFGTEVMQYKIQELLPAMKARTFWINALVNQYKNKDTSIVISDVRFPHEITAIYEAYGRDNVTVVKVMGVGVEAGISGADADTGASHCSEQEWTGINEDLLVNNTGTKDDLYMQLHMHSTR
jgi:hypothetical protein